MSHNKQYPGRYIGEIVSVADPDKKCRVKARAYDIFDGVPVDDLPWAVFSLPFGARANEGGVVPVHVGDLVWIEFIGGDTRRPVVVGSATASPGKIPNLPADVCQGANKYVHKRTGDEPAVSDPGYYEDVVFKQNNALIQLCKAGNIRITQMTSGSAIELLPSGDIVIHTEGNLYATAGGNLNAIIQGNVNISSNAEMLIKATYSITLNAPTINIQGALNTMAQGGGAGTASISGTLTATGDISAGSISLQAHTHSGISRGSDNTNPPS